MKQIKQRRIAWSLIKGMVMIIAFFTMACLTQTLAQTNTAIIYLDSTFQIIRGFGANNIVGWRPDMTPDEIQTAFGTDEGQLGFTIMRVRIPPDSTQFRINVPSVQAANDLGVKVIASPWTPPAWMKTNNNIAGGSLDTSKYAAYAAHLKAFADTMANNGAPVYAVSVQNEPDWNATYESCLWNATQFLNFMKNYASSIGVPVYMPESLNFNHHLSDSTLNDPVAAANVAFVGGHIYGSSPSTYPLATSKGKELWMTEHYTTSTDSANKWSAALPVGQEINDCMTANMSAYLWWYIVRFYGPIDENGNVTKRGYVMSQFSRFIRPGFIRVYAAVPIVRGGSIYVTAYKSNSQIVIVALNMGSSPVTETFTLKNLTEGTVFFIPYVTSQTKNVNGENAIAVSNSSFTATLEASSITTFVADATSGVSDVSKVPYTYTLSQNYPNPFNPTTNISFSIPTKSYVTLKVFDLLGRTIATLVDKELLAGKYSQQWNAADMASGFYFYRLTAGSFTETKKLVLLR